MGTQKKLNRKTSAFTLLEMMLVVAIIGILMGVAVWNIVGQSKAARERATRATMRTIQSALGAYKADKGSFPPTLQTLITTKMIEDRIKDSWKHDLIYATPGAAGKEYSLLSLGDDGQQGTEDDIDAWRIDEQN